MDKITVAELAAECSVKNQVVLAELKRLGLYVFSPTATIDINFAEVSKKSEKKSPKKTASEKKEHPPAPAAAAPKKARKSPPKVAKAEEVKPEEEETLKKSLAPRKGRKHYDRDSDELVDIIAPKPEEMAAVEQETEAQDATPVAAEEPLTATAEEQPELENDKPE